MPGRPLVSLPQHEAIVTAITARDPGRRRESHARAPAERHHGIPGTADGSRASPITTRPRASQKDLPEVPGAFAERGHPATGSVRNVTGAQIFEICRDLSMRATRRDSLQQFISTLLLGEVRPQIWVIRDNRGSLSFLQNKLAPPSDDVKMARCEICELDWLTIWGLG